MLLDEQLPGNDAGERDDRTGRQIDAAGDDNDGGANGGDAVNRRVLEDEESVSQIEERMRARALGPQVPGEEQDLEREDRNRAQLANPPHLLAGTHEGGAKAGLRPRHRTARAVLSAAPFDPFGSVHKVYWIPGA